MFIDIGNGNVIQSSTIIAVIDYEFISSSMLLQEMIDKAKQNNKLKGPGATDAKSVIVTTEATYFSSLSVATLKKRTSIKAAIRHVEDFT